jgi:hypothetical protein
VLAAGVALPEGEVLGLAESLTLGVGEALACGEPKSIAKTGRKFNCAVVFN